MSAGGMRLANGLEDNVTLWAGSASPIPAVDPAYKTVFVSDGVPATKAASASKCCEYQLLDETWYTMIPGQQNV